jgi:hypothetical protein
MNLTCGIAATMCVVSTQLFKIKAKGTQAGHVSWQYVHTRMTVGSGGAQSFLKTYETSQNSRHQKDYDVKHVKY